jgi:hypothetical protein
MSLGPPLRYGLNTLSLALQVNLDLVHLMVILVHFNHVIIGAPYLNSTFFELFYANLCVFQCELIESKFSLEVISKPVNLNRLVARIYRECV